MRVLVFSDTHGRRDGMDKAIAAIGGIDAVFHAGDVTRDAAYLQSRYEFPVYQVRGNNDIASDVSLRKKVCKFEAFCGRI